MYLEVFPCVPQYHIYLEVHTLCIEYPIYLKVYPYIPQGIYLSISGCRYGEPALLGKVPGRVYS